MGRPFGYLYTIDAYGCPEYRCNAMTHAYTCLEDLVKELGMTMQGPPFVYRSPEGYKNSGGFSGWVGLIESGIQIHTMNKDEFVSIDIYTCCEMPPEKCAAALGVVWAHYHYKDVETNLIERGKKRGTA